MIRMITGEIAAIELHRLTITVNGIGYLVNVSFETSRLQLGSTIMLHTYLAVRETALDLYGFSDSDSLDVFEKLLTIPKVGPKSAQQILSQADIVTLKQAVINNDPSLLTKIGGIGKKTSEKIVLGLKDSFDTDSVTDLTTPTNTSNQYATDTIDALVALGYPHADARKIVQNLPPDIQNANDAVREALKQLGQT